jgi:hypothetical protein
MDFIEKLFGLSPDNGDGSTEFLWLAALTACVVAVLVYSLRRQRTQRERINRK